MILLCYALALFGAAYIAGHSLISRPFRQYLADRSEHRTRCWGCNRWSPSRMWGEAIPHTNPVERPNARCPRCGAHLDEFKLLLKHRSGFKPLLWPVELVECPACFAFWAGLLVATFYDAERIAPHFGHPLTFAVLSAGLNAALGFWVGIMQSHTRNP